MRPGVVCIHMPVTNHVFSKVKLVTEMEVFSGVGLECLEKVVKHKYACIAYDFAMVHLRERNLSDAETRKLVFAPARTYNIW